MWAQDKRDKDSIGGLPENFNHCWKLDAIRRIGMGSESALQGLQVPPAIAGSGREAKG
jgi:hypothetical protein